MDESRVRAVGRETAALQQAFCEQQAAAVVAAGRRIAGALRAGRKLLVFGNGGSAADAQHFAAELVGRYLLDRRGLAALALTTDPSVLTSVSNDLGFEQVFRRQVEAHGQPGDVAFGITTSGRSPNVLTALDLARERGLVTMALTGQGGASLAGRVEHLLAVPSGDTPRVQEVHGLVVHLLCEVIEEEGAP